MPGSYFFPFLQNTWEPKENILDSRLIDAFNKTNKTPKKSAKKRERILDDTDSEDDSSQVEDEVREPPVKKKEKVKVKEHQHSPHSVYNAKKEKRLEASKKASQEQSSNILKSFPPASPPSSKASTSVLPPVPKLVIPLNIAETTDTNSSSSDDQPLGKDISGAKRKVEVLSKASGKVGVKIKTSGVPLKPKPVESKPSTSSEESSSSSEASSKPPKVAPVIVKKTSPIKLEKVEPKLKEVAPNPTIILKVETKISTKEAKDTKDTRESRDATECLSVETPASNGKNNIADNAANTKKLLTSPRSAHPKLWLPTSQPSTDHVFITDVTVNYETVTIRECKTDSGFFKPRDLEQRNSLQTTL